MCEHGPLFTLIIRVVKTTTTTTTTTASTTATAPAPVFDLDAMLTAALKAQERLTALKEKMSHLQGLRVSTHQELEKEQAKFKQTKGKMERKKAQAQMNHVQAKVNGVSKVIGAVEKQMREQVHIMTQYKVAKQQLMLRNGNGGGENDMPSSSQQQPHKHNNKANKKYKKAKALGGTGSSHHSTRKPRSKPLAEWAKKDALMRHLDKQNELSKVCLCLCAKNECGGDNVVGVVVDGLDRRLWFGS